MNIQFTPVEQRIVDMNGGEQWVRQQVREAALGKLKGQELAVLARIMGRVGGATEQDREEIGVLRKAIAAVEE